MPFTLTLADAEDLILPVASRTESAMSRFLARCTPETTFQCGAGPGPRPSLAGTYTFDTFKSIVLANSAKPFVLESIKLDFHALDVVGNRAFSEQTFAAKTLAGEDYMNKFAQVIEFDDETGKIAALRSYYDTQLRGDAAKAGESA